MFEYASIIRTNCMDSECRKYAPEMLANMITMNVAGIGITGHLLVSRIVYQLQCCCNIFQLFIPELLNGLPIYCPFVNSMSYESVVTTRYHTMVYLVVLYQGSLILQILGIQVVMCPKDNHNIKGSTQLTEIFPMEFHVMCGASVNLRL